MGDEEIRYIRTGDERWTQQTEFAVQWKISAKGNPYLKTDVHGVDVVLTVFRSAFSRTRDQWTYGVNYGGQWAASQRFFIDEESAKTAALGAIGRMRRGGESGTTSSEPPKREPVRDDPTGRRIRL